MVSSTSTICLGVGSNYLLLIVACGREHAMGGDRWKRGLWSVHVLYVFIPTMHNAHPKKKDLAPSQGLELWQGACCKANPALLVSKNLKSALHSDHSSRFSVFMLSRAVEVSTPLHGNMTSVTSLHWTDHLLDILIFRCKIFRHHWHHSAQPRLSKTCLPCPVDPHHPSPIRPTARCTDPPKNWQQETHKQRDKIYAYIELFRHMLWDK